MKIYGRVFVVMAMVGVAVASGAPPVAASVAEFSPPSDDYVLAFEDEFDAIDPDDWSFREGERLGGFNEEDNVEVSGGNLHIAFLEEDAAEDSDPGLDYTGGGPDLPARLRLRLLRGAGQALRRHEGPAPVVLEHGCPERRRGRGRARRGQRAGPRDRRLRGRLDRRRSRQHDGSHLRTASRGAAAAVVRPR